MKKHRPQIPARRLLLILVLAVTGLASGGHADEFPVRHFDRQVIAELNLARTNPREYARILLKTRPLYKDKKIRLGPNKFLLTEEGVAALDEAVAWLRKAPALQPLGLSWGMSRGAWDHVLDQSVTGQTGHVGCDRSQPWERVSRYGRWRIRVGENIAYGGTTARDVVSMLLIDDGVPSRGHRENIFVKEFKVAGVAHGKHKQFRTMCVIELAGGFTESN